MLNKIAKRVILLLCTITVVGILSGCTETILSQNGPSAVFVAGKLDSDNTFSKSVNWLENTFPNLKIWQNMEQKRSYKRLQFQSSIKYS